MLVTNVRLGNWRNFREANVRLRDRTYLLGANATGKSNFLDVFRFLRDLGNPDGGGLQKAILLRGGIPKLRCLHARRPPEVRIEVELSHFADDPTPAWRYILAFKPEGKGAQRTLITQEQVWKGSELILDRPNAEDKKDIARLTQTYLQQTQANSEFREVADFFGEIKYLHLVPQLLKFGDVIGGQKIEGDPFGQGFLEGIARSSPKIRESRLRRIEKALARAVPKFKQLRFSQDTVSGRPHLEALYEHHRPNAGWQREDHFSDGTLRLLSLLWLLLENNSLLLLEEPELSLNDGIVKEIPQIIARLLRDRKKQMQIIITTHSEALLSNPGIDGRGILLLEPAHEGTKIRSLISEEIEALRAGFTIAEVVLPKTRPAGIEQLGLF